MPGLDPGIHDEAHLAKTYERPPPLIGIMDCRVKPGNDDRELRSEGRKIATQALLFTLAAFFFPAPPTSTWPPMSAMRLVPVSAMVTVSYTHLRAHETPEHLVC